ncbi:hypothetical protein [Desulfofustis limnaeus]|uniref:Uncharacterized protein n=1 Tax=Desulfofustis limnaeus TaxID=2740163 RepID=A0ABM7WCZ4_9BACT|nr:hypothetical protein [Desulfofustis limnaeus]BDD88864.1 hypothetical protein DPPLL_32290 [Desulfofustis limnaeus]
MATPTVYKWDDGDAPVLNGLVGSFTNLLKKCLVEGYTDKAPAGWTIEFENLDGTTIALRNSHINGTGSFLRIADGTIEFSKTGYEFMSSIDTGLGQFDNTLKTRKSDWADGSAVKWVLIATSTFFHFFVYPSVKTTTATALMTPGNSGQQGSLTHFCFGDFISMEDDGFNVALCAGFIHRVDGGASYLVARSFGTLGPSFISSTLYTEYLKPTTGIVTPRYLSGQQGPLTLAMTMESPIGGLRSARETGSRALVGPEYRHDGPLYLTRPMLMEAPASYTYRDIVVRGYLPGLFFPCHDAFGSFIPLTCGPFETVNLFQTLTKNDRTFMLFPHVANSNTDPARFAYSVVMVDIGGDWDVS